MKLITTRVAGYDQAAFPSYPHYTIAELTSEQIDGFLPLEEIQRPVRGAIAVDMEGAIFYRTVADFPGLHSLLVKGVCDYADSEKDDSYHEYASAVSATYTLCFIKEYVTTILIPDTHRE